MRLVYEQIIDAQVLKLQHVVLTARIHQLFELCLLAFLDFFKVFDSTARHAVLFPLFLDSSLYRGNLFVQLSYLPFRRYRYFCKRTLRDNNAVPVAESNF